MQAASPTVAPARRSAVASHPANSQASHPHPRRSTHGPLRPWITRASWPRPRCARTAPSGMQRERLWATWLPRVLHAADADQYTPSFTTLALAHAGLCPCPFGQSLTHVACIALQEAVTRPGSEGIRYGYPIPLRVLCSTAARLGRIVLHKAPGQSSRCCCTHTSRHIPASLHQKSFLQHLGRAAAHCFAGRVTLAPPTPARTWIPSPCICTHIHSQPPPIISRPALHTGICLLGGR
jgi:hypothetical protein